MQTETIVKKIMQPKSLKTKKELTKICNDPGNNVKSTVKISSIFVAFLENMNFTTKSLMDICHQFWLKNDNEKYSIEKKNIPWAQLPASGLA